MAAKQFFLPFPTAFTSNGLPAAGASVTFYQSGTTTKAPVYTSSALTTELANPVVANGAGRLPTIYLDSNITYRLVIKDSAGSALEDVDPYTPATYFGPPGINGGTASNLTIGLFTGCAGQDLTAGGTLPAPEVVFTSGYREIGKGAAAYVLDAAVDAAFVLAHSAWSFLDSEGNGYRLSTEQRLTFEMFGAYGDNTIGVSGGTLGTDDYPAWLSFKDFADTYKENAELNPYYKSVPALHLGRHSYYSSDYWDFTDGAYQVFGYGPGAIDRGGNTSIWFASGVEAGFVWQSWDTAGISSSTTNTAKGTGGSLVQDVAVYSLGGTIGTGSGMIVKAPITLIRCRAYYWGHSGFMITADSGSSLGNANCWKMQDCVGAFNGVAGLTVEVGGDDNAGVCIGFNGLNNGQYGWQDGSFLGNLHAGFHTDNNGTGAGPPWVPAGSLHLGSCAASGHWYRLVPGQETWCSTNGPSGTTADNQGWLYYADGSPGGLFPTWTTGQTWKHTAAAYLHNNNNSSLVLGGYMESDQLQGYADTPNGLILNELSGWDGGTPQLRAISGALVTAFLTVRGLHFSQIPVDAADDTAAAGAGLTIGDVYRTGSTLKVRVA